MGRDEAPWWWKITQTVGITLRNPIYKPRRYKPVTKNNFDMVDVMEACCRCKHRHTDLLRDPCRECKYSGNVIDQDGRIT